MSVIAPLGVQARGYGWRHAGRAAWAIQHLDFHIEPGERVLLLGASGVGKSTLLAAMAGLSGPGQRGADGIFEHPNGGQSRGQLLVNGQPVAQARRSGQYPVGLLLQDPHSQTVLARCGDDIAFGLENLGVPRAQIWPRVRAAAAAVGFDYPLDRSTSALSGGERQRLTLAGVLALRPGLLLLDEPTAMLDAAGADLLRAAVGRVLAETAATCIVVEHRVQPWLELLQRVIVLGPEGVLADGPIAPTLAAAAPELAAAGVWLPEKLRPRRDPPAERPNAAATTGPILLSHRQPQGHEISLRAGLAQHLTGPNGAGKSTWALQLAGLSAPSTPLRISPSLARGCSGPPHRWSARQLVSRIGTVFQQPELQFVAATVAAELEVGPHQAGPVEPGAATRPDPAELLARLRLDHLALAHPCTLSGGEQRRLSVATALATAPQLLILDEPTFGQDARTWAELVAILRELLDQGVALLAVTHDSELIAALGGQQYQLPARTVTSC